MAGHIYMTHSIERGLSHKRPAQEACAGYNWFETRAHLLFLAKLTNAYASNKSVCSTSLYHGEAVKEGATCKLLAFDLHG